MHGLDLRVMLEGVFTQLTADSALYTKFKGSGENER